MYFRVSYLDDKKEPYQSEVIIAKDEREAERLFWAFELNSNKKPELLGIKSVSEYDIKPGEPVLSSRDLQLKEIGDQVCRITDLWIDTVNDRNDSYILGYCANNKDFYMAEVNQGKENQAVLEFDYRPSRRQVEDKFIDFEAKRAIDRQEQLINRLDNLEGCEDNPVYAEEIIEIRKELVGLSEEECNVPSHSLILAREIDQFFYDFDVYDYRDQLTGSREDNIDSIRIDLESENVEHMLQALSSIMDDSSVALHADDNSQGDEETYNKAKELIEDIKNYIALNKFLEQKSEDPNSSWIEKKIEEQAQSDAQEEDFKLQEESKKMSRFLGEKLMRPRRGR